MYAGRSGCYGIVIYNTDIDGENAVYGYYEGNEMRFETGTAEQRNSFRRMHGCEHAVVSALTKEKPCEMEVLQGISCYDTERELQLGLEIMKEIKEL